MLGANGDVQFQRGESVFLPELRWKSAGADGRLLTDELLFLLFNDKEKNFKTMPTESKFSSIIKHFLFSEVWVPVTKFSVWV